MRKLLILVALAGCADHGEGGDAHTLTTCDVGKWEFSGIPVTHCAVACAHGGVAPDDTDGNGFDDRCANCPVGFYVELGAGGCCRVRDPADIGTPNVILDFTDCPQ